MHFSGLIENTIWETNAPGDRRKIRKQKKVSKRRRKQKKRRRKRRRKTYAWRTEKKDTRRNENWEGK